MVVSGLGRGDNPGLRSCHQQGCDDWLNIGGPAWIQPQSGAVCDVTLPDLQVTVPLNHSKLTFLFTGNAQDADPYIYAVPEAEVA